MTYAERISPGSFEPERHYYPKALNATIHPMVAFFLNLSEDRVVARYCHLNPRVRPETLREVLRTECRYFRWAGADLINVTDADGRRQMVVIENNSCPSGQKSMPLVDDHREQGGYRKLVEQTIAPYIGRPNRSVPDGRIAVVYDKNRVETSGYAAALADALGEEVYLAAYHHDDPDAPVRYRGGVMQVRAPEGDWLPVRGAFRYLTQRPWTRLPLQGKTRLLNPIVACLAGGRNKAVAAKAYDLYNGELADTGLQIRTPETVRDVSLGEVPIYVAQFGGLAVVKVPYSNAGQGVYTITSPAELEAFMAIDHPYERFIVQSLIGNSQWSSTTPAGRLFHVGTIPNARGQTYVADIRVQVASTPTGLRPISVYGRRAAEPLADALVEGGASWPMLGTNLSRRLPDGAFETDPTRLVLMDRRDFNRLGIGLDDLIEAYVQTALSTVAIERVCRRLHDSQGRFRMKLFRGLNDDESLLGEIMERTGGAKAAAHIP